jgi:hypothetical protein
VLLFVARKLCAQAKEQAHLQRYMFDIADSATGDAWYLLLSCCSCDHGLQVWLQEASSSILRFINSREQNNKQSRKLQNTEFRQVFQTQWIIAVACKPIEQGEELIAWYGPGTKRNIAL